MESTTFKDSKVIKELEKNYISIKVHPESKEKITWQGEEMTLEQFSAKMGVFSLPSMLFLNKDKEIVGSYLAYADGKMMYNLLTYISSGSREHVE